MLNNTMTGTEFYYANRKEQKPVKCTIMDVELGHPMAIIAEREDTKEIFQCFRDFGCYDLDQYEEALEDAQIKEDRIIK